MKKVVIVGGGISGLVTAYRLTELGRQRGVPLELTVIEASERLGGVIDSGSRDGFLMEGGPDSFISEKPAALQLLKRLGIENEIIETREGSRRSFLYFRNQFHRIPDGFFLFAPSRMSVLRELSFLSWPAKIRMISELLIPPVKNEGDESVAGFIRRRFGREVLERIGQPMLGGIYTADPEQLSLRATMPRFLDMEQMHGSVIRALMSGKKKDSLRAKEASGPRYSLFLSFKNGMETWVRALVNHMPDVRFLCAMPIVGIEAGTEWKMIGQDGSKFEADAVCLALPAARQASLLKSVAPDLCRELSKVPYESVATVNLAFKREDIQNPLEGFGFVIPAIEKRKIVGCTFASVKFQGRSPEGFALLRAFVGGAFGHDVWALADRELERTVVDEVRAILRIHSKPVFVSIKRHPDAMPQYQVGHLDLVSAIEEKVKRHPGLFLTGNGFRGVGIPDCIDQAEKIAEQIIQLAAPQLAVPPTPTQFDHVLVIGFGGPERPEEVRPFIEGVARGTRIPEERLGEVEHHYERIGGSSPYNRLTQKLVQKLEEQFVQSKLRPPVFLGMRNWRPFLKDVIPQIKARGLKKGIGIILAPHRSEASFECYVRSVAEAKKFAGAEPIQTEYIESWHRHPLFIKAQADQVRKVLEGLSRNDQESAHLIFSAHSIPLAMAGESHYAEEFKESSELVAKELGCANWSIGYQSRSGRPTDPWLEPSVASLMSEIREKGGRVVVVVPIGFLCDNAEVLYDLDIEAREAAQRAGLRYRRAQTVEDHPDFVEMMIELIQEKMTLKTTQEVMG